MQIAFDCESTGPDRYHGSRPFMVTATSKKPALNYVWEWPVNPFTREVTPNPKDIIEIREMMWDNEVVFHNSLFDIPMLASVGVIDEMDYFQNGKFDDTMVMASIIHNDGEKALKKLSNRIGIPSHDEGKLLKAVESARFIAKRRKWRVAAKSDPCFPGVRSVQGGFRHFDYWLPKQILMAELEDGNKLFTESHEWMDVCEIYATMDTERTLCLYYPMKNEIEDDGLWDRYKFTMSLLGPTCNMRSQGMPISWGAAQRVIKKFRETAEKAFTRASKSSGGINPNSAIQLGKYLESKVPITSRTKTGQVSTDEDTMIVIRRMEDTPEDVKEVITQTLIGKKCDRSASMAENYVESLDYEPGRKMGRKGWGVIHSDINPVGTPVNRFSAKNPNTMAVRKRDWEMPEMEDLGVHIRQMFCPPPGWEMWTIDFDQLHLRMVAYLSNERNMIKIFESGGDIHWEVQQIIFQQYAIRGDQGQRRLAKDIDFGYIYGARANKITSYVNSSIIYRSLFEQADDGRVYERMIETFPNAPPFLLQKEREAKQHGYIMTADGVRLYLPDGRYYAAVNYYIQGTEGYLAKKALLNCFHFLRPTDVRTIMVIHDELLFLAPMGSHKNGKLLLGTANCLRSAGDEIGVKCEVEVKVISDTETWYKGRKINLQELAA